jgi:Spy/CpxP family protein refolding chaperone
MKVHGVIALVVLGGGVLSADDRPADCPMHAEAPKPASAPSAPGPYAGREERSIKALPDDEARGYVDGRGMGLAQPAELNHYPGPRHVLDAARELALTAEQTAALEGVFSRMDASARRLGAAYVAAERELDTFFTGGGADPARLSELTRRAGVLLGELRAAHLAAHVETRAVLTPEQIAGYDRLRGYGGAEGHARAHHH